ncbi:hypothetical protein C8J56DRAFT_879547 [Mycena floridula]|nr:hypothetical protein C8J56DRAFT_879547 [Mycena floridula]
MSGSCRVTVTGPVTPKLILNRHRSVAADPLYEQIAATVFNVPTLDKEEMDLGLLRAFQGDQTDVLSAFFYGPGRHILSYWDIPVAPAAPAHGPSVAKPSGILVPLYNENNVRIGFVQTTSGASEAIAPEPTKVAASVVIKAERMTGPVIIPFLTPSQVAQAPPKSIFDPATWLPGIAANAPPSKTIWDGWPNGELNFDLTQAEYNQTGKFSTHWACSSHGVGGSIETETWEKGQYCAIIIRPKTTRAALKLQLDKQCNCGASLYHTACGLKGKVPKVLHLLPQEREEFQQLSSANPTLGAAALVWP